MGDNIMGNRISSEIGSGMIRGEICVVGNASETVISSTGKGNKVQFVFFDTNGFSYLTTPDHTEDHIQIQKAGKYFSIASMHADSIAGAAAKLGMSLYKNNGATEFSNIHGHRDFAGGGSESGAMTISGIIDLAVDDTVELWLWNETNTQNIILADVTLSLFKLGS